MTMYLPGPDIGPIGAEAGEFLETPLADVVALRAAALQDSLLANVRAEPDPTTQGSPASPVRPRRVARWRSRVRLRPRLP